MTAPLKPWDRMKGESPKAYGAFCVYRDIPVLDRSVAAAARALGRNYSWVKEWAGKYNWKGRAESYDGYLEEQGRRAQLDAVREMNDRHARTAMAVIGKIGQRLVGDEANNVSALDPNTLTPSDLAKLADVFGKMERMARGEETERMGIKAEMPEVKVKVGFEVNPHLPDVEGAVSMTARPNLELDP